MVKQFYTDWKNNNPEEFYKNYEFDKEFLYEFFKVYHNITYHYNKFRNLDWIKNNIEKVFLNIIIELEDEYIVIKFMKKHNLDYKKLYQELR